MNALALALLCEHAAYVHHGPEQFSCQKRAAPLDPRLHYTGRWEVQSSVASADWPCTSVGFQVRIGETGGQVGVRWYGLRTRVLVKVADAAGNVVKSVWKGPSFQTPLRRFFDTTRLETIELPPCSRESTIAESRRRVLSGRHSVLTDLLENDAAVQQAASCTYRVTLTKLTSAVPFGNGIGSKFMSPSVFRFYGAEALTGAEVVPWGAIAKRRIEFVGASDTSGFCVDGTPEISDVEWMTGGWKYDNCALSNPGQLSALLDSEISVEAIAGIGLTQNAESQQEWQLGKTTFPGYYTRTLQSDPSPAGAWDFSSAPQDLVVASLGGNDYNHQGGHQPSDKTFAAAYESFLLGVFGRYNASGTVPTVVSICGQGSPAEAAFDPDNNRCKPCEHVKTATKAFQKKFSSYHVEFILIPCDGSVVTGKADIGCNGHKNARGQRAVAEFLAPKLAKIMGWAVTLN